LAACGQDVGPGTRDARQTAWAAESIAANRTEALYPELLRVLHELKPSETSLFSGTPDELAIEAVADAIIKTNLKVPSEDARKLYPEFPALAMILLSRSSDDNTSDLLWIFKDSKGGEVWLAAANLLAVNPKPEFVSQLVSDFNVFVRILVFTPREGGDMSYGDCYSQGRERSRYSVPTDWPKISMYSLTAEGQGVVFAPGRANVAYLSAAENDALPWRGRLGCGGLDIESLRRELLVTLAGKDAGIQSVVLTDITETSDQQARQGILRIVEAQATAFREITEALVSKGILTSSDQKLHMDVMIVPFGKVRVPELPTLASLGIVGDYRIIRP
jgi:hypothetical protein